MKAAIPLLLLTLISCATMPAQSDLDIDTLERSLRLTEIAFAETMARRDFEAFRSFLDDDAIFSTSRGSVRGKEAIAAAWSRYFEGDVAPFAWRPERVHVRADGAIGGTTGPVTAPDGTVIGHFVSTWKRLPTGQWKIILDLAPDACD